MMQAVEHGRLVEVENLKKHFPIEKGMLRRTTGWIRAVDDLSFVIERAETLALVGESGCGKTTTGRCLVRAIEPTSGSVRLRTNSESVVDMTALTGRELRRARRYSQMIFQDPYSSLSPRMTVFDIVAEPLVVNKMASGSELQDRVTRVIRLVGLEPSHLKRYPHAFSGGQRQRIGIARALATDPLFIVADEPVSALDVSIQAQILNLLLDLQNELELTFLFISHDLRVVRHIADRVAVMYVGKIVETGPSELLYDNPRHPYTEALLSAVPVPIAGSGTRKIRLPGEVANPAAIPGGCPFHPRCRYAEAVCRTDVPELREDRKGHFVACHLADGLALQGMPEGE